MMTLSSADALLKDTLFKLLSSADALLKDTLFKLLSSADALLKDTLFKLLSSADALLQFADNLSNSLDGQNVGPDLGQTCLTLIVFLK